VRALLSVTDKTGIVPLASGLAALGWELLATDGTAATLAEHGLPALSTSDWTGVGPMLGGRVKTLHHRVFTALLCRGDRPDQVAEAAAEQIVPVDLIAGNFHRFGARHDLLDSIDIGGPAMMRAAAKNHPWVVPLVDPTDYGRVLDLLRTRAGAPAGVPLPVRRELAAKAFLLLSELDARIAGALTSAR
jgi:phosphoribosylaminoimidazolecarboxamide formyltransferase/IMP cyclohydrolase